MTCHLKPLLALASALLLGPPALAAGASPTHPTASPMPQATDQAAIQQVLDNYTRSVSTGDRALFESQLLDEKIPFFGLGGTLDAGFKPGLESVQKYADFRKSVFESGRQYSQSFSGVKIEQDGDLAQVSLHFRTLRVASGDGGEGWKVLHLLRVGGQWKIASEFYTVRALAPAQ